jgi:hypothetical protein
VKVPCAQVAQRAGSLTYDSWSLGHPNIRLYEIYATCEDGDTGHHGSYLRDALSITLMPHERDTNTASARVKPSSSSHMAGSRTVEICRTPIHRNKEL